VIFRFGFLNWFLYDGNFVLRVIRLRIVLIGTVYKSFIMPYETRMRDFGTKWL